MSNSTPTGAKPSAWTDKDSLDLVLAVNGSNRPTGVDWAGVAAKLGTGRNGNGCQQHFSKLLRNAGHGTDKATPTNTPAATTAKAPTGAKGKTPAGGRKRKAAASPAEGEGDEDDDVDVSVGKGGEGGKAKGGRGKKVKTEGKKEKLDSDEDMSNGEGKGEVGAVGGGDAE